MELEATRAGTGKYPVHPGRHEEAGPVVGGSVLIFYINDLMEGADTADGSRRLITHVLGTCRQTTSGRRSGALHFLARPPREARTRHYCFGQSVRVSAVTDCVGQPPAPSCRRDGDQYIGGYSAVMFVVRFPLRLGRRRLVGCLATCSPRGPSVWCFARYMPLVFACNACAGSRSGGPGGVSISLRGLGPLARWRINCCGFTVP